VTFSEERVTISEEEKYIESRLRHLGGKLKRLGPTERFLVDKLLEGDLLWMPHPENVPQIKAYVSEADILYFGGAAGGGKSDLLLGLALTAHKKSIIFRREYLQLRERLLTVVRRFWKIQGHVTIRLLRVGRVFLGRRS